MPSFEIPDGPATVPLKAGMANGQPTRAGSVTYSVTNKGTTSLAGRLSVLVAGDAKAEWFQVDGEKERQFTPGETQTVTVNINVPPTVKPGAYKFRPRVVAVNDPDNDHTDGPVATMQVIGVAGPKPPGGKKFPIWIIFVIIGAVVVIGGAIAAFILLNNGGGGDKAIVPDLAGKTVAEAQEALKAVDPAVVVKVNEVENAEAAPGTVIDQAPKAEEKLTEGQEVVLTVAVGQSVAVPDVVGRTFANASGLLEGAAGGALRAVRATARAEGKPPETVLSQEPVANSRAPAGSEVKLTVDPGVATPKLTGLLLNEAINIAGGRVNISSVGCRVQSTGRVDEVLSQSVTIGTVVAKDSDVSVTVRKPLGYPCARRLATDKWIAAQRVTINPGLLGGNN